MSFVADACALVAFWASPTPDDLMPAGTPIIRGSDVAVHAITVWEISQTIATGKLSWPSRLLPLTALLIREQFSVLPFTWEDGEAANGLPPHHKDPMDRMLIASALRTGMTVITSDHIFARYGVRTVW